MGKEKILAVDDEEDILELIQYNLTKEGYQVVPVTTGEEALKKARSQSPDLILLDLMLPGLDGLEVCKVLKNNQMTQHIPIVMVTAKGEESDIITGLELGADDYITKPFSPKVLIARVRAVMRRKGRQTVNTETPIAIHELVIHPGRHEVSVAGEKIDLTFTEFKILHFLASKAGWVFTRYQIVDAVRGMNYAVTERSVDVQVVSLRRKMGAYGDYIETVRGIGYRFKD
ncbi:MAG: response regulator transcription factor [Acidobacteria bacterium]|nr:response regulator transcription factor [Acidobacteriota bacterium]